MSHVRLGRSAHGSRLNGGYSSLSRYMYDPTRSCHRNTPKEKFFSDGFHCPVKRTMNHEIKRQISLRMLRTYSTMNCGMQRMIRTNTVTRLRSPLTGVKFTAAGYPPGSANPCGIGPKAGYGSAQANSPLITRHW